VKAIGLAEVGRLGRPGAGTGASEGRLSRAGLSGEWLSGRAARALGSLVCVPILVMTASVVSANAESFTWAGNSIGRTKSAAQWSVAGNWQGGTAPEPAQAIESLSFPHLAKGECESRTPEDACYLTDDEIAGLTANSLRLDDADDYLLDGEDELTLGGGGLTATPENSRDAGAFLAIPLKLSETQTWSIANRNGGALGENGLALLGEVVGENIGLTARLSKGSAFVIGNSTEVGPLTIEGAEAGGEHIDNGVVTLAEGELNSTDRQPVDLRNAFFLGSGQVGALATENSTLDVGDGAEPAGGVAADDVSLGSNSGVFFEIVAGGTTAQKNYSQLTSTGPIALAGNITVAVGNLSMESCPTLSRGQKYTLVSTTGGLSGSFSDASEGQEIPIDFEPSCGTRSQMIQIKYHREGGVGTVIGTIEGRVVEEEAKRQEEAKRREGEAEEEREAKEREARAKEQETIRKNTEEPSEARQREEAEKKAREEAERKSPAIASMNVPPSEAAVEGPAAKGGVLGSKSKSLTRAELLAKALRQCKKQPKKKQAKCEAIAKKKYGSRAKAKKVKR
jgi:hypothetical protein